MYEYIDLHMLSLHKKVKLTLAKHIKPIEAFEILKAEKAWQKNLTRKEDFYFSPSKTLNSFQYVFLDDPDLTKVNKYEAVVVKTSRDKYQAYVKLSKPIKPNEYKTIAKALINETKADKAVNDTFHLRRLVGFYNTKYNPPSLVIFYAKYSGKPYEIKHTPPTSRWKEAPIKKGGRVLEKCQPNRKTWWEFYSPTAPSFSEVDFAYACYLLKIGYEAEEVKSILREESPKLYERHRNVEDYLERTLKAALRRI